MQKTLVYLKNRERIIIVGSIDGFLFDFEKLEKNLLYQ